MSVTERVRLAMFSRVKAGELGVAEAGRKLGLSERQARRVWRRYRREGDAGLVHGLRGRAGNAAQADRRTRALALYRQHYAGFNAAHAAEKLAAEQKLDVPRQTLWRWLGQEGLVERRRKGVKHRRRREPKACVGELIQMDGSTHAWFSGRGPACVLFVMIDDATGRVFCRFYATEDTAAAFDLFGRYVKKYGLPLGLYVDKDSIYRVNDEKAREAGRQRGQMPLTQFGRAMKQLGVKVTCANSPQAKGRVERMNGTLQDRLVAELAAAGIGDLAAANAFLETFLPAFNRRFTRTPAGGANLHRPVPPGVKLAEVLCGQDERTVGRDWCVRWGNRVLQLDAKHEALRLPGKKVQVLMPPQGPLQVRYRDRRLSWRDAGGPTPTPAAPPPPTTVASAPARQVLGPQFPRRPAPDHPWRNRGRVKAASVGTASLRSAVPPPAALTPSPHGVTILLRR